MPQGAQRSWGGWIGGRMSPYFRKSVLSERPTGRIRAHAAAGQDAPWGGADAAAGQAGGPWRPTRGVGRTFREPETRRPVTQPPWRSPKQARRRGWRVIGALTAPGWDIVAALRARQRTYARR